MPLERPGSAELPNVILIGAGVVGQAIAEAHLARDLSFVMADQNPAALRELSDQWRVRGVGVEERDVKFAGLPALWVGASDDPHTDQRPPIVIESIVEQTTAKQQLFDRLQHRFGDHLVLCTNTSTLQLAAIATDKLRAPGRVCGMHFFMPVHVRPAVEIVTGPRSDPDAVSAAIDHATRLGKQSIRCQDGPGFIVNRMLSPYLNQALWLLCRGAREDPDRTRRSCLWNAAIAVGTD